MQTSYQSKNKTIFVALSDKSKCIMSISKLLWERVDVSCNKKNPSNNYFQYFITPHWFFNLYSARIVFNHALKYYFNKKEIYFDRKHILFELGREASPADKADQNVSIVLSALCLFEHSNQVREDQTIQRKQIDWNNRSIVCDVKFL